MPTFPAKHRAARYWQKISITIDSRMTEAVSAYLADLTGTGLEISPSTDEPAAVGHLSAPEKITAYIPIGPNESGRETVQEKTDELRRFLARTTQFFPDCRPPLLHTEIIAEEDWGQKWKSFFTAMQITPSLVIRPSWENDEKGGKEGRAGSLVIEMDPGLAFGTGHHASTQLALTLLEELFQKREAKHEKILDVGTGSGILAMACALFGAREVLALDNDPDAVAAARQNIIKNRLEDRVTVSGRDVASLVDGFDIIAANITHDVLTDLAGVLNGLLAPGGYLVLSGILKDDQENSIRKIYTGKGLHFIKSITRDEWASLQFQKKCNI